MTSKKKAIAITAANLGDYLGVAKYRYGEIEAEDLVGMVTGLAWTDVGGELLTHRWRHDARQGQDDRHG